MLKSFIKRILSFRKSEITNGPILPTIIQLALPLMISSVLHTTQSLVDMFWVGRLGSASIAAVGISGTIIMVLVTLIFGVSSGTVALVSQNVGAKKNTTAGQVAMHSLLLAVAGSFIIAVFGFIFARQLLATLGASSEVVTVGTNYLRIILVGGVTMFVLFLSNSNLIFCGSIHSPHSALAFITFTPNTLHNSLHLSPNLPEDATMTSSPFESKFTTADSIEPVPEEVFIKQSFFV